MFLTLVLVELMLDLSCTFLIPANPPAGMTKAEPSVTSGSREVTGGTFQALLAGTPALPAEGSVLLLGQGSRGGHRIPPGAESHGALTPGGSWHCCALGYEGSQLGAVVLGL